MAAVSKARRYQTFQDVFQTVGDVAPQRILLDPPPGKGTTRDVIRLNDRTNRLYELVDGILVEKIMGLKESLLAATVIRLLGTFVEDNDLGAVAAPDGMVRLAPELVRIPDVSFISWRQMPGHVYPNEPIPHLAPDLAVEVLSEGNTPSEMERKLKDYFFNGVRLVWFLIPKTRSATIYTAPDQAVELAADDSLDGGDVLPGLVIPLRQVFARVADKLKTPRRKRGKPREAS